MRHDSRLGLAGCENGIFIHSALTVLVLLAASEEALAAGGAEKTGLAAHEDILLLVLYVSLALFFVLLGLEIFDRIKQKKHEDDSLDIIDKEFKPANSVSSSLDEPASSSPIAPSDDDPFKALLNKAKDGEAPGPYVPKSGYKASGKPGLSTDSIRRAPAAKEPENPVFDGSATIPVGVTVPRPQEASSSKGLGDAAPMTRNLGDSAAPMTRDLGSAAPVTKNLGGDESADPFRRLAKIGEEEQAMSSVASRPAPASSSASPASFGSQTLVAPVTPRVSQANDDDPWKKLLSQSSPAGQAVQSTAPRAPGMPGAAMPGGARQPGMPGAAMPGGARAPGMPGAAMPGGARQPGMPGAAMPGGARASGMPGSAMPGGARQPGMPGASMPGGTKTPGMPGAAMPGAAMPGAVTSKLSSSGAPAKVSLGTPGASKEDDPWKALLNGMSKPPAGNANISPGASATKESGEWPKAQPSRQRGISLDIKRGDMARMSSPDGEE